MSKGVGAGGRFDNFLDSGIILYWIAYYVEKDNIYVSHMSLVM